MKLKLLAYITLGLVLTLAGCAKDNYEPPTSVLSGRVVYNDQPVGVRSNGVQLELWQPGFQLYQKIPIYVAQDGTFSASLFDGDYKLIPLRGNGPWATKTDTINVQVRGSATVDVPVDPYFVIKNEKVQRNANTIDATFNLQQVNTSRKLERVNLYIGTTTIVDANNSGANAQMLASSITNLSQPVTLSINLPASLSSKSYVYARIGVKTEGVGELVYSAPVKIQLK